MISRRQQRLRDVGHRYLVVTVTRLRSRISMTGLCLIISYGRFLPEFFFQTRYTLPFLVILSKPPCLRFGMGAALSGTMRSVIQKAAEHATQRVQFGGRIDGYGAIQEKIARYKLLREILLVSQLNLKKPLVLYY